LSIRQNQTLQDVQMSSLSRVLKIQFSRLAALLAFGVASVALACSDQRTTIDSTGPAISMIAPRYARAGGSKDTARANMLFADSVNTAAPGNPSVWSPAGIRGDGRDKFGQPSTFSEYQGNYCGVSAVLGAAVSSLNADTDFGYTSSMATACGSPARLYRFYYDGAATPAYSFGPHHTVMNLGTLAVGQSLSEDVWYGVQQPNCGRLWFSNTYPPSNNVVVTRLADVVGPNGVSRQWRVESTGSHRAMCVVPGNGGKFINTGVSHFLPFSYVITEVLPPAPVYP
jgi:hypothetical protein